MEKTEGKLFVTAEEKERANNVNLLDYLLSIGEPLKPEGRYYYRHVEHDSLVVNSRKNYFSWNSRDISGNAVTYLMSVYDLSFQEAVKQINKNLGHYDIKTVKEIEPSYPEKFDYNVKEVSSTDSVFRYLVEERKIDSELVKELIQADLIKEDIHNNVVFKWKENGELIGANLQGTREIPKEKRLRSDRPYFKMVLPTTKEATYSGFSLTRGYPEKLYFFESPIDLLSYLTLNKKSLTNCLLRSMDGLKEQTVLQTVNKVLKDLKSHGRDLKSITLCVDNDEAGKTFINNMKQHEIKRNDGKSVFIDEDIPSLPVGEKKWDWNNELKARIGQSVKKNMAHEIEI